MNPEISEDPLDVLAESFLARYRRGERPALTEYTERHPHLAGSIRELFPALVELEDLGSALGPVQGDSPIPDHLGEYRILRVIGRGGMGVVYEAVQESLGRRVALKVLSASPHTPVQHFERFQREARIAARLHHGHIVPVFGVGVDSGVSYYAMQFIAGQGLDEVLGELRQGESGSTRKVADGSATANQSSSTTFLSGAPANFFRNVARLGQQAAEALAYAHDQGVLHRDIKPSNLILDTQSHLWVADFGLATIDGADDLTRPGDLIGTIRYMAPERFEGRADARSDVYSLGVTLYEMLGRVRAFPESDHAALMDQIADGSCKKLRSIDPAIPRDLETIVHKAMAREPEKRYAGAAALAEDLRRFVAGEAIAARPPSVIESVGLWAKRNPAWAALMLVCFLSLTAIAGIVGVYSVKLRGALSEANANLTEAQAQNQRADENLADLRQAVDQFTRLIERDPRLQMVDLTPVRRKLLESAVEFYEKIAAQSGDRIDVLVARARTFDRIGTLLSTLGRSNDAKLQYERGVQAWEELVRREPNNAAHLAALGGALHNVGSALTNMNQESDSLIWMERAEQTTRLALTLDPSYEFARGNLIRHLRALANRRKLDGNAERAERDYREALDVAVALAADFPDAVDHQVEVAECHHVLGNFYRTNNRVPEAGPHYLRALEMGRAIVAKHPRHQEARERAARAAIVYSEMVSSDGPNSEAERLAREGAEHFEVLATQFPSRLRYATELVRGYARLGSIHLKDGRHVTALDWLNRAVDIISREQLAEQRAATTRFVVRYAHQQRGNALMWTKQFEKAADDFSLAVKLAPSWHERQRSLLSLAGALALAGKNTEAEKTYRDAIAESRKQLVAKSGDLETRRELAKLLHGCGEMLTRTNRAADGRALLEEAIAERRTLLAERPDAIEARHHLEIARSLVVIGMSLAETDARRATTLDAAVAALEQAVAMDAGEIRTITSDSDFGPLKTHPRFAALIRAK